MNYLGKSGQFLVPMKEGGNNCKGDKPKEKNTAGNNTKEDGKTGRKQDKGEPGEERMAMNAYSLKSSEH